ncbi:Beta-glucosidase 6 [Ananas comosus]|uniref:Beta-glucosidase 6 n=1 Tax=Ananas comosus TaxID=4615 RepID=A0A199UGC6_ANACO|nr:Beta-glucosidase 6 [Ananas comosus]
MSSWGSPRASKRFIDPLVFGDYPISMRTRVKNRLPRFTSDESALIKRSLDFVGISHYTTYYAQKSSTDIIGELLNDTLADSGAATLKLQATCNRNETLNHLTPDGNGITRMDDLNGPFISINDALKDDKRIMQEVAKSESFECYITFGKLFFMKHYKVPFSSKYV